MAVEILAARMESKLDVAHMPRRKRLLSWPHLPHGDVSLTLQQILGPIRQHELQGHLGMLRTELCQDWRQHFRADDFTRGDSYRPLGSSTTHGCAYQRCGGCFEALGVRLKLQGRFGGGQSLLRASKKRH